ncbi:GNAT family N-acetyltransferase [Acinetobacter sp. ANC 3781]
MAVLPEWQRQGIASALIRSSVNQLKVMGTKDYVVLDDPNFYS